MSSSSRLAMNNALKKIVVPYLREHGFKGSFPHFRRQNKENIDLISFQYNRYGGSFTVNLATCPPDGINTEWGSIPPNKVIAYDSDSYEFFRLSENVKEITDHWFDFETAKNEEDYDLIALQVKNLLHISDRNWIKETIQDNKLRRYS